MPHAKPTAISCLEIPPAADRSAVPGNNLGENRIAFLDAMRAVAIFMVVGQHAIGYNQLDPITRSQIAVWFQIAVPVFFLVDGFLLLMNFDRKGTFNYRHFMQKSIRRLLIPWIVFSIVYASARLVYEYFVDPPEIVILNKSFGELVPAIWVGASSGQMYFLMSLFILRTFSFLTIWLKKTSPLMSLCSVAIAGIVWWSSQSAVVLGQYTLKANWGGGQDPLAHALWGMQFYLIGCAVYLFHSWLNRHVWIMAAGSWSVMILVSFFKVDPMALQQYSYLLGFYFMFIAFSKVLDSLSLIGRFTMGIYLLHFPVIMKAISFVGAHILDPTRLAYYWIVSIAVYLVSLVVSIQLARVQSFRLALGEN